MAERRRTSISAQVHRDRIAAIARGVAAGLRQAERKAPRPRLGALSTTTPNRVVIIGIQNGAAAIDWLRSHQVSVKAASMSPLGTRYLVSNEFGELDLAAVVAIARRKGFAG